MGAGAFAMTAFLWHLTALVVTLLVARALGVGLPEVGTAGWWWTRPLWFALLAVPTAVLVAVFVRADRGPRAASGTVQESRPWVDPLAAVAAGVVFFGILMVSIVGVDLLGNRPQFFLVGDVLPWQAFAVLVAGLGLLRASRPRLGPGDPDRHPTTR